jgi:hypothetical protein
MKKSLDWTIMEEFVGRLTDLWENENWQKVNHHDKTNGLSQRAVNSYRREHPGSKLKTAVTTKPSKLKPGSKAAKRRKSFCARMSGNKGPMKKPNGKPTPKALALRRWNCESIEEMRQLIEHAEQEIAREKILQEKWTQKYKSSINCSHPKGFSQRAHCAGKKKHTESMMTMEATCPDCGMCQTHGNLYEIKKGAKDSNGFTKCWPGHHAAGTKKGKNGGQVRNCVPNESQGVAEGEKHGLYYNVNKRKKAGTSRPASSPKAPTAQAWRDAAKTAKKESVTEGSKNSAQEHINQILRSQAPNGDFTSDRYLDWIIGPESIDRLVQRTKLPLNRVRNYVTAFRQNPDPEGVAEGAGAQQAAIAIAKKKSGKYTQDGQRKK